MDSKLLIVTNLACALPSAPPTNILCNTHFNLKSAMRYLYRHSCPTSAPHSPHPGVNTNAEMACIQSQLHHYSSNPQPLLKPGGLPLQETKVQHQRTITQPQGKGTHSECDPSTMSIVTQLVQNQSDFVKTMYVKPNTSKRMM